MDAAVRAHGWDGAWFRRAYDYFGDPVGAAENEEGRIFIEPQDMCVAAGIGLDDGTAEHALASVAAHLATPHGIVLQQPPTPATTSSWARSAPTRPATRRAPASSATPTRGS